MERLPKFITEKEVSEITGRALQTLRNDRHQGRGIPYCKISSGKRGSIRYSLDEVLQFMENRKVQTDPI